MDKDNKGLNESLNKEFMDSLNEKERMAYHIAKSHLGTMFSLDKCNAFLEWLKERDNKLCESKLCESKLCESKLCESKLCESKLSI